MSSHENVLLSSLERKSGAIMTASFHQIFKPIIKTGILFQKDKKTQIEKALIANGAFLIIYGKEKGADKIKRFDGWQLEYYAFKDDFIEMRFKESLFKDGEVKFTCKDIQRIHINMMQLLESMMSERELKKLKLDQYPHRKVQAGDEPLSARFIAQCTNQNKQLNKEVMRLCAKREIVFSTAHIAKWEDHCKQLYWLIETAQFVESLILEFKSNSFWSNAVKRMLPFSSLKHIEFRGVTEKKVGDLGKTLSGSSVKGLTFQGMIKKDGVDGIIKVFDLLKLDSISFINIGNSLSEVLSKIGRFSNVRLFGLGDMKLDEGQLHTIINNFSHLSVLNLWSCGLEVYSTINSLSVLDNLRVLSLRGNIGVFGDCHMTWPARLFSLDVSNIEWDSTSFGNFVNSVVNCHWPSGFELFLDGSTIPEGDVGESLKNVCDCIGETDLTGFSWDRSVASEGVICFIGKCKKLEYLSLCCTFSSEDGQFIESLSRVVPTLTRLNTILLQGSKDRNAGIALIPLLQSMKELKSLNCLDIEHQRIGDDGLRCLIDLVQSQKTWKFLSYDDCGPEECRLLMDLVDTAEVLKYDWGLMFPSSLIGHFFTNGKLTMVQALDIKRRIQRIQGIKCENEEFPCEVQVSLYMSHSPGMRVDRHIEGILGLTIDPVQGKEPFVQVVDVAPPKSQGAWQKKGEKGLPGEDAGHKGVHMEEDESEEYNKPPQENVRSQPRGHNEEEEGEWEEKKREIKKREDRASPAEELLLSSSGVEEEEEEEEADFTDQRKHTSLGRRAQSNSSVSPSSNEGEERDFHLQSESSDKSVDQDQLSEEEMESEDSRENRGNYHRNGHRHGPVSYDPTGAGANRLYRIARQSSSMLKRFRKNDSFFGESDQILYAEPDWSKFPIQHVEKPNDKPRLRQLKTTFSISKVINNLRDKRRK